MRPRHLSPLIRAGRAGQTAQAQDTDTTRQTPVHPWTLGCLPPRGQSEKKIRGVHITLIHRGVKN